MRYERSLLLASRAMMPLLVVEYLIGTYVSFFVLLPAPSGNSSPLEAVFTAGSPFLIAHVLLGALLLALSLLLLLLSLLVRRRRTVLLALIGLSFMTLAFASGIAFVQGGYTNDALSYGMAVGFMLSFLFYGTLAGTAALSTSSPDLERTRG